VRWLREDLAVSDAEDAHDAIVEQCAQLAERLIAYDRKPPTLATLAHCCTSHCLCILADRIRSLKRVGGGTYVEGRERADAELQTKVDRTKRQLDVAIELLRASDSASIGHEGRARWVRVFDALMNALGLPDRRG
jgi:hypothetical protein